PTRDSDDAGARSLRELTRHRADRTGGGGDDDGLALLRLADFGDAAIGGCARHAENAQVGGERCTVPAEFGQALTRRNGVGLPAAGANGDVARYEVRMPRGDHLARGLAGHDI